MGQHLADRSPVPPPYCWGATGVQRLLGKHRAAPGSQYCDACKAKNAAVVAQLKAQRS